METTLETSIVKTKDYFDFESPTNSEERAKDYFESTTQTNSEEGTKIYFDSTTPYSYSSQSPETSSEYEPTQRYSCNNYHTGSNGNDINEYQATMNSDTTYEYLSGQKTVQFEAKDNDINEYQATINSDTTYEYQSGQKTVQFEAKDNDINEYQATINSDTTYEYQSGQKTVQFEAKEMDSIQSQLEVSILNSSLKRRGTEVSWEDEGDEDSEFEECDDDSEAEGKVSFDDDDFEADESYEGSIGSWVSCSTSDSSVDNFKRLKKKKLKITALRKEGVIVQGAGSRCCSIL